MDSQAWNDTVKEINEQLDIEKCLAISMDKVITLLNVERGSLMLLDEERQELSIKAAAGLSEGIVENARHKVGEGVSGWVAMRKEPLLVKDIDKDERFLKRNGSYHNDSLLSVPLLMTDKVLGVLNVSNKVTGGVFKKHDMAILNEIASHIAVAVYNALKFQKTDKISQMKLDFVSIASHDLRSPLTSVREVINLILDEMIGEINSDQERFLTGARDNVDRVIRLVNELLDISRLESNGLNIERNLGDICSLARSVHETLKINADKRNIKFELEIPDKSINMWFNSDQITRALINLVGNAIESTQDDGMVSVKIEDLNEFVRISVKDNGRGIEEEELDKIFDKFHSVAKAKSSGMQGTGLGLPIVKEIVALHSGEIRVQSQVDRGSTFRVVLPKDIRTVSEREQTGTITGKS